MTEVEIRDAMETEEAAPSKRMGFEQRVELAKEYLTGTDFPTTNEKLDELAGTNPFQVFGEGGFLDRQAKEAPAPKFDRIPPTQHELAITTSASPGSTIENVTLKSSGTTLKTGINNVTGS